MQSFFLGKSRHVYHTFRDVPVERITLIRYPLPSFFHYLIHVFSGFSLFPAIRRLGYDALIHIYIVVNDTVCISKNGYILQLEDDNIPWDVYSDHHLLHMDVEEEKRVTLHELLDNLRKYKGDVVFTEYDIVHNNCQKFVDALLHTNGLWTEERSEFYMQDAEFFELCVPKYLFLLTRWSLQAIRLYHRVHDYIYYWQWYTRV